MRKQLKIKISGEYKIFNAKVEKDMVDNPKEFWRYVNLKKGSSNIPSTMTYDKSLISGPKNIADAFATYFQSVFNPPSNFSGDGPDICSGVLHIPNITENEISAALEKLKRKNTAGPDRIPSIFLKDCSPTLVKPLFILFNKILTGGVIPKLWKISKIVPILKKGDRKAIENYRPIALINNFAKIFEMVIFNNIYFHLKSNISENQHGFMHGRSTVTNLVSLTQFLSESIDEGGQTDVIYMDFSKAFDKISHNILLYKLGVIGFSPALLKVFHSYLCARKQFVYCSGCSSKDVFPTSGVPQGSVLGPLLFSVFINDISHILNVDYLLYADDLKIFTKVKSTADCVKLHGNLNQVLNWCKVNELPVNKTKCYVMSFSKMKNSIYFDYSILGELVSRPNIVHGLGVKFDRKLSFSAHFDYVVSACFRCT